LIAGTTNHLKMILDQILDLFSPKNVTACFAFSYQAVLPADKKLQYVRKTNKINK